MGSVKQQLPIVFVRGVSADNAVAAEDPYLYGLTGVKNSYAAQKWLTLAAQSGQRAAQEQLAFFYQDELMPLYNPINSYYWFSVIIGDHPEYREKMQNMEWTLRSRGLLATAQTMPKPVKKRYKGVDFNSLFPLR